MTPTTLVIAPAAATYTIEPADDLGAMPSALARTGLTFEQVTAWLAANEDVGTFVTLDEADGQRACLHPWGLAGGACACECGRPECPDTEDPHAGTWGNPWYRALVDLLEDPDRDQWHTPEQVTALRLALPSVSDEASLRTALAPLDADLRDTVIAGVTGIMSAHQRAESPRPSHDCPGWVIASDGSILPCSTCDALRPVSAFEAALAWAATLPVHPRHKDHDECTGCCGFDVCECDEADEHASRYAILFTFDAEEPVFGSNREAQDAARAAYAAQWPPTFSVLAGGYRVGSLTGDGGPVANYREALTYAREWSAAEAADVVIVEKLEAGSYVPVRAFWTVDGEPKSATRGWLARKTADVASGAVPWHRVFVEPSRKAGRSAR